MYVCLCEGVSEKDIKEAICNGHNTMKKLQNKLGVGTQCGKCGLHTKAILDEAIQPLSSSLEVPPKSA